MKKPTLKEENARLRAELEKLKNPSGLLATTEIRAVTEALDCEPDEIVETLRTLREDLGCGEEQTMLQRADELTAIAAGYEDAEEAQKVAEARAESMTEALAAAIRDRKELLRRLGLSGYQWSAMGGACDADLEVP